MDVDVATCEDTFTHDGQTYHFCCDGCRDRFAADPARYLHNADPAAAGAPPHAAPAGAIYTCPMHPEVRHAGPGSCPYCGMALDPLAPTADEAPNRELIDMTRRLWIGGALTLPLFGFEMAARMPAWIAFVLATPVVLWAGWPFFERAWASVVHRSLNMFSLIALGAGSAYLYSVVALIAPQIFPAGFRAADGSVAVYFEPAAVIIVLVLVGQVLELRARAQTGGAIRALLTLAPKTAWRIVAGGADTEIPLADVRAGDELRVRPGDVVPVDGVVIDGVSALDESMVTGESMPVAKAVSDALIGGTINGTGSLVMRAEKIGADTMLARIVSMVAQAQRSRAPIQGLADRVASFFVPIVLLVAVIAFAAWAIWGPPPVLAYALVAAVSVLIIACPCALGLATPMSISVAIGKGASLGVLIRSAEALERMERVRVLLVDKTGTLTAGKPAVTAIEPVGISESDALRYAASLERASEHPLASAIVAAATARGIELASPTNFASVTGQGVTGDVDGHHVALGNAGLMASIGAADARLAARAEALRASGATALFLALDGTPSGVIALADPIKPTTADAVRRLRADGIRVAMLTGDDATTANAVAQQLGITDVHAGVLPDAKQRIVASYQANGAIVAMAGDGVNDAPALAAADVGIAMGTGTDVAMQSAGITLVKGDLAGIVRARALSRATMRNIRENLIFAFAYNAIGIPIAAGALYLAFGLLLSPMIAALAMSFSSVSVIANALRLRKAVP
jgi:Cu+-exporting ATPase